MVAKAATNASSKAGSLLQFALSRTREFDADLDAAGLTEDPIGLASALEKIERSQGRLWETIFLPGRRVPDPSLLRTHPDTQERMRRLLSLRGKVPETTYVEYPTYTPVSRPLAPFQAWSFGARGSCTTTSQRLFGRLASQYVPLGSLL